jgi:hypothetical protein
LSFTRRAHLTPGVKITGQGHEIGLAARRRFGVEAKKLAEGACATG